MPPIVRKIGSFSKDLKRFDQVELEDHTSKIAMISLPGPCSKKWLTQLMDSGQCLNRMAQLAEPRSPFRTKVRIARTGYTAHHSVLSYLSPANTHGALGSFAGKKGLTALVWSQRHLAPGSRSAALRP
jgi:glycine cleavage system aminomethyltransferase T